MLPHHERPSRSDLRRRPRPHRQSTNDIVPALAVGRPRPRRGRRRRDPGAGRVQGSGGGAAWALAPARVRGRALPSDRSRDGGGLDRLQGAGHAVDRRAAGRGAAARGQPAAGHVDPRTRLRPVALEGEASPESFGLGCGGARPSGDLHADLRAHLLRQRTGPGRRADRRRHGRPRGRTLRPRRWAEPRRRLRDRADAAAGGRDAEHRGVPRRAAARRRGVHRGRRHQRA